MKQVLIAKNPLLKNLGGDKIELVVGDLFDGPDTIKGDELVILEKDFNLRLLSGDNLHVKFDMAPEMAYIGLFLLGASLENGKLKCAVKNFNKEDVVLDNSEKVLLIGTLLEKVSFRQVEDEIKGGVVNISKKELPTPKGKRRTKKAD